MRDNEGKHIHYLCLGTADFIDLISENLFIENTIRFYLHLAKYAEKNTAADKYLNVYDPLIKILESGGMFVLKINALDIVNGAHIPLNEWYENFVTLNPIDIE